MQIARKITFSTLLNYVRTGKKVRSTSSFNLLESSIHFGIDCTF